MIMYWFIIAMLFSDLFRQFQMRVRHAHQILNWGEKSNDVSGNL